MTHELEAALNTVFDVLKRECGCDGNCVVVDVRFAAIGYWVNYEHKTAESLRKDFRSMRNICGEFIK